MRAWMVAAMIGGAPMVAQAQDLGSMQVASMLGTMLAAEEMCGLTYDLDAIDRFIDDKVAADDMDFAGTLRLMTAGAGHQHSGMSEAEARAHCRQIARSARANGFIE